MNEDVKCIVKSSVLLGCCPEDKPCGNCSPTWQRTIVIDDCSSCWFPVIGMTNKVLKKLVKSEFGMLIDRSNGTWYVEQGLALEIAENKQERENLLVMIERIKEKYNSSLSSCAEASADREEASKKAEGKVAEVDELS